MASGDMDDDIDDGGMLTLPSARLTRLFRRDSPERKKRALSNTESPLQSLPQPRGLGDSDRQASGGTWRHSPWGPRGEEDFGELKSSEGFLIN